ncbi:FxsB family radical SAM/SPASM domain protein [Solwaraspora sp. WMMD1047]|uniref:FxsB family cyclophane-forming radical SAM/SPASM peptide maturase n=1 Tax=Solwaraspora sp. WMMD1047 TaxID=3016102 RepID=UPI002415D0BC|nr:FxsB family cyclophane-forming radical SAM/SPASM peptide maturase [Solwaraspora sp. WMMD1047]MDG4831524.1 FxsB family radical SAM/SPASM domain protein [Solwaraspora sp. WMMD1047]
MLKVHSRCNLACDYCYMYELADRSTLFDPAVMSDQVFERTCSRIAEHVKAHRIDRVRVVFHGGEPLLAGLGTLTSRTRRLRELLPARSIDVAMQTNGVLLTESMVDQLASCGVRVGISLDGDRVANDRHRRHRDGRTSFPAVDRALRLLANRPESFAGILCVVDVDNDPVRTYESLTGYHPPVLDFLLPHANWDQPPPGWSPDSTRYGDWLVQVFERYYTAPARHGTVRLFEEIIRLLCGAPSRTETVGLSPVATIVINVDGAYEQIDTLRSAYPGAVRTDLNVFADPLDAAMAHPAIRTRQAGVSSLSTQCGKCPIRQVCGGGYYPHRYRAGSFLNPSIYCADLDRLIRHISSRLQVDLAKVKKDSHVDTSIE